MPRPRSWTDDQLREAVRVSRSLLQVCRHLGIPPGGETYQNLRWHVARLGLEIAHVPSAAGVQRRPSRSWTDDELRTAVRTNVTISGVLRSLGYSPSGGMHRYISTRIHQLDLDTSHFVGRAWARGRRVSGAPRRPLDEILVANSPYLSTGSLRRRLIREGLKRPLCEVCGLDTWRGEPLPLALDHVNGDPTDNRLENLRILCPNCHALTDTWCGRRRSNARAVGDV